MVELIKVPKAIFRQTGFGEGIDKLMNVADNFSYDQAKSQQLRNTSKTFIMASNNAVLHAKEFAALDGSGETIYLTNPQSAVY